MKIKYIILSILPLLIIILYLFVSFTFGNSNNNLIYNLKLLIPNNIKEIVKENLFSKKLLIQERLDRKEIEDEYLNLQKKYSDIPNVIGRIDFKLDEFKSTLILNNKEILSSKYSTEIINIAKFPTAKATAYIDSHYFNNNNRILLVTGNGTTSFVDLEKINNSSFSTKIINNNIKNIIKYDKFYIDSKMGVKDILIKNDKLYVSLTFEKSTDCFTTAIIEAKINYEYLNFNKFFIPSSCVLVDNEYGEFNPHHSGGRMISIDNNYIYFSTGEYRYRDLAQDPNNQHGKILKIDIKTKDYEIISLGHRNVQGMDYNLNTKILYMSEHGPKGGDEINSNEFKINSPNYGWPISSYGEHYGKGRHHYEEKYLKAPLHKSHEKYGFVEPLTYFIPSIGISQILIIDNELLNSKTDYLIVSSMGNEDVKEARGLHFYKIINKELKLENFYKLDDRIRDIILLKESKVILIWGESQGSIYKLNLN